MSFDFPNNPGTGSTVTDANNQNWTYNGMAWVRSSTGKGIEEAPTDSIQYVRENGAWAKLSPEELFLGSYAAAPLVDNYGSPLQEGMLYFDTNESIQKTWNGSLWQAFAAVVTVSGMKHYIWKLTAPVALNDMLPYPDDYGNTPIGWQDAASTKVQVYKNGLRLIEQTDPTVLGDYTVDYVTSR